jgi:methylase of polypeptide subunit release factors
LDGLAGDLRSAGFSHARIEEALGERAMAALGREYPVAARRALAARELERPDDALAALVRLFLLAEDLPAERLDAALPRLGAEGALELGLIEAAPAGEGLLRASIDLRPHASDADAELWVASDLGAHQRPGVLRHDHVLGIGQASLTLAAATIRRPAARALDVGVGCGIQTFHLLAHCEHVTATDLSERALAFTRFNLLLNAEALGLDPLDLGARVRLLRGSLLEPVAGQEFDLVVSNPPFVITPRRAGEDEGERFTYRDGGMAGDTLVASLWRDFATVLAPGGTVQMLANWEIPEAALLDDAAASDPVTGAEVPGWAGRPAAWTPEGVEAWVIQRDVETPEGYAETWLRDASETRDRAASELRYAQYLDDFASRGVGGVGLGLVWLRRTASGAPAGVGRRFETIEHPVAQPLGPTLGESVWRLDAVASAQTELVHAVVPDDVTVETHSRPGDEHPQAILLRQGAGLRRVRLLSTAEAGLVSACDGELPLGSIARAVCALLEASAPGSGPSAEELLASARDLLAQGFLRFLAPGE